MDNQQEFLKMLVQQICLVLLCLANITDMSRKEIPNWLTIGGIVLIVVFGGYILSLLVGLSIGICLWKMGKWGGGDMKLLPMIASSLTINYLGIFFICLLFSYEIAILIKPKKIHDLPLAPITTLAYVITFFLQGLAR